MEEGILEVEKVGGKSKVTRCFSRYPLKFIVPSKVGSSKTDAVWIYTLSYGGGIVSGDCISCSVSVGEDCTAVLTTQASTKVYKSVGSKCSEQFLEARVGPHALLAILPDPVTCFSTARYTQKQIFRVASDSSLIIVDWLTSGRHESGEKWDFELYKSTNNIFLDDNEPLFLDSVDDFRFGKHWPFKMGALYQLCDHSDPEAWTSCCRLHNSPTVSMKNWRVDVKFIFGTPLKRVNVVKQVLLEQGSSISIADRMQQYQVIAMVIIMGPRLKHVQDQVQDDVKKMMSKQFYAPTTGRVMKIGSDYGLQKPAFIASCSVFGPQATGVIIRISAVTTESVYEFLRHHLASMEPMLGASPYF